jgi:hypothetical protein
MCFDLKMTKTVLQLCLFLAPLVMAPLVAQDTPPPPPPPGQRPAPKNLKLLKPEELMPTMFAFRVALGEQCTFCHVKGDFASDENPHKEIARGMIVMARDINAKFPDGKTHVTCYTCHRGSEAPLTAPPAAAAPAPAP